MIDDLDMAQEFRDSYNKLSPFLRNGAVNMFYDYFMEVPSFPESLKPEIEKDSRSWWIGFHFYQGMSFRNMMREHGYTDKVMGCNLDDVYIQLIEKAMQKIYPDLKLFWEQSE